MDHAEMSSKELLEVLNDIDEQDWLEAKSLRDDTSRSILETACSFSNEPGPCSASQRTRQATGLNIVLMG